MAPTQACCAASPPPLAAPDLLKEPSPFPAHDSPPASLDLCQPPAAKWTAAFEWTLPFPLSAVWELTRDFATISKWLPSYMRLSTLVEGSPQQPGCIRSVVGYDEKIPAAFDKLLELDERNHKFKYQILTCHLPLLKGHSPTFHFVEASPKSTTLKFSCERPPVPYMVEEDYRAFVQELYGGFAGDLIKTLSASAR